MSHSVLYNFSGLCLYLDDRSTVDSYECDHFTVGCPTEWHYSQNGYERKYYYYTSEDFFIYKTTVDK